MRTERLRSSNTPLTGILQGPEVTTLDLSLPEFWTVDFQVVVLITSEVALRNAEQRTHIKKVMWNGKKMKMCEIADGMVPLLDNI